ncbi:MAG: hypothetical protein FWF42_01050 [Streptococcaceae bacterium]|nr:hypothetical protein [Streptococcaceae bacterium]MCL2680944.1 hypothetical protein [Streptococcaceae bacterium]MCL2858257.1 hypothetical protein [Streptococcaceae bacterium]
MPRGLKNGHPFTGNQYTGGKPYPKGGGGCLIFLILGAGTLIQLFTKIF